ncbi:acyl-CoA desaturase [Nocardia sp. NPDC004860]|uniref:fatty acid desaturase family protein n=1 Tax=Nocardia sp. NPDC004860 TaxID=3154557 RepID=UPI0033AEFDAA
MAVRDIKEFAHLNDDELACFGAEIDRIRREITDDLGERDVTYIRRAIAIHRGLEVVARVCLIGSRNRLFWVAGAVLLGTAKSIENTLLGHNISHGQWDWMNDPEIHSTTWEWDIVIPSSQWRVAHNNSHHVYTNIRGIDADLSQKAIRMSRDTPWHPRHMLQPITNIVYACLFEYGAAAHHFAVSRRLPRSTPDSRRASSWMLLRKAARQLVKDYLLIPALTGRSFRYTVTANLAANTIRNLWMYVTIICGHFPDGAEKFEPDVLQNESRAQWHLRQLLGAANFHSGPVLTFLSGGLGYQIEHHLFPDLPCNRYPEISVRVRAVCARYDLPYTTGSLVQQFFTSFRTILKLSLPDMFLRRTDDDAPETSSEKKFVGVSKPPWRPGFEWRAIDSESGRKRGLSTAIAQVRAVQG